MSDKGTDWWKKRVAEQKVREADPRAYNAARDLEDEQCPYGLDHDDPDEGKESCMWKKGHEGLHTTHWGRTKGYWVWEALLGEINQDS